MRSSDAMLSVGIVGAGEIARKSHLPVLAGTPDVRIAWLYDRRPEPAQALARAYGLRALSGALPHELPRCDVVLLAIPVDARAAYLDDLAARGGAALCEKPFALTAAEHRRLIGLFESHALGAGFMRRYFRSTMLLRRVVAEGLFGRLLRIEIAEGNRSKGSGIDASFLDDPRLGAARGVLADLGSHGIDLALHVSGAAGFDVRTCEKVMDGAVDRKVTARVLLHTGPDGRIPVDLRYVVSWLDRQDNRIRLTFEHAEVWSGLAPHAEVFVGTPGADQEALQLSARTPGATTYNQAFYLQWQEFIAGLRAGRESRASACTALLTTSLVESLLAVADVAHA